MGLSVAAGLVTARNPLAGVNVHDEPPPEREAAAVPVMPGIGVETVSRGGVTAEDAVDAAPVPAALVAVTVKVYGVPLVRPVTTNGLATPLAVAPPGLAVTV